MSSSLLIPNTNTHQLYFPIFVIDNGGTPVGMLQVSDVGFELYSGPSTSDLFASSGTVGFKKFSITYNVTAL